MYSVLSIFILLSTPIYASKTMEKNDHQSMEKRLKSNRLVQAEEVYSTILRLNKAEKLHQVKEFEKEIKMLDKMIDKNFPSMDVFKAFQAYKGRKDRDSFNNFMVNFSNYHNSLKAKKK